MTEKPEQTKPEPRGIDPLDYAAPWMALTPESQAEWHRRKRERARTLAEEERRATA